MSRIEVSRAASVRGDDIVKGEEGGTVLLKQALKWIENTNQIWGGLRQAAEFSKR